MSAITQAMKNHHAELLSKIAEHAQALAFDPSVDPRRLDAFVAFLKDDLLPHAASEEKYLYPVVDPLVRAHGRATATMSVDHEFISGHIRDLEAAATDLHRASGSDRAALAQRISRLAIGLEALFRVHLEKEERVYLPLFDEHVSEVDQQRVLDSMHEP